MGMFKNLDTSNLSNRTGSGAGLQIPESKLNAIRDRLNKKAGISETDTTIPIMPGEDDMFLMDQEPGFGAKLREAIEPPAILKDYTTAAIEAPIRLTNLNMQRNHLMYEVSEGNKSKEVMSKIKGLDDQIAKVQPWAEQSPYILQAVGELAPQVVRSMTKGAEGAMKGAMVGGVTGAMAGPGSPITVPAAAAMGATALGTQAALEDMRRQEQGAAYDKLIRSGVPEDVAVAGARVYGLGAAGLEGASLKLLTRIIPGSDKIFRGAFTGALKRAVDMFGKNAAARTAGTTVTAAGGEAFVETTQQLLQNAVDVAAKEFSDQYRGTNIAPENIQAALTAGLAETFGKTFTGFAVLAVPGAGYRVVTKADAVQPEPQKPEWPGLEKTGLEQVREPEGEATAAVDLLVPEGETPVPPKAKVKPEVKPKEETPTVTPPTKEEEDTTQKKEKTPTKKKQEKKELTEEEKAAQAARLAELEKKGMEAQKKEAEKKGLPKSRTEFDEQESSPVQRRKADEHGIIPKGQTDNGDFEFSDPLSKSDFTVKTLKDIPKKLAEVRANSETAKKEKEAQTNQDIKDILGGYNEQDMEKEFGLEGLDETKDAPKVKFRFNQLTKPAIRDHKGKRYNLDVDLEPMSPSQASDEGARAMSNAFDKLRKLAEKNGVSIGNAELGFIIKGKFVSSNDIANAIKGEKSLVQKAREKAQAQQEAEIDKYVAENDAKIAKLEKQIETRKALRKKHKPGDLIAIQKILGKKKVNKEGNVVATEARKKTTRISNLARRLKTETLGRDVDREILISAGEEALWSHILSLPEDVVNDYARGKMDRVVETPGRKPITVKQLVEGAGIKKAEYAMRRAIKEEHGQRTGRTEYGVDKAVESGTLKSPVGYEEGGKVQEPSPERGMKGQGASKVIGTPKASTPATDTRYEGVSEKDKQPGDIKITRADGTVVYMSPDDFKAQQAEKKAKEKSKAETQREKLKKLADKNKGERPEILAAQAKDEAEKRAHKLQMKPEEQEKKGPDVEKPATSVPSEATKKLEAIRKKKQAEKKTAKEKVEALAQKKTEQIEQAKATLAEAKVAKEKQKATKSKYTPEQKQALEWLREDASEVAEDPMTGEPLKVTNKMLMIDVQNILDGVVRDWMQPDTVTAVRKAFKNDQTKEGRMARPEREGEESGRAVQEQGAGEETAPPSGILQAPKTTKVKPLKGESIEQAHQALTKQGKQVVKENTKKRTKGIIGGLKHLVDRLATGKPVVFWRGQPDTAIGAGAEFGTHLAITKLIPSKWFLGKRKSGEVNVLKRTKTTKPLNLIITNDAGANWDNPSVLMDAATFARNYYGKENDRKIDKLVAALQSKRDQYAEMLKEASDNKQWDFYGEIQAALTKEAIEEAGFDGVAYENTNELTAEGVNKLHRINVMLLDPSSLEVLDTRVEGNIAPPVTKAIEVAKDVGGEEIVGLGTAKLEDVLKKTEETQKLSGKKVDLNWLVDSAEGSTPIFTELAEYIIKGAKTLKDVFKNAITKLDVQYFWNDIGAEETGLAIKNIFSRREAEETKTLTKAHEFMKLVVTNFKEEWKGSTKEERNKILSDVVRSAERGRYLRSLDPEYQAKLKPAVQWMRDFFDYGKKALDDRGIHVDFKERMLSDLRNAITETTDRQKQVKIMQRIREIKNMEFTHIPLAMWSMTKVGDLVKATGQKEFNKANAKLKQLTTIKRKALSINNLIEKGILDPQKVNPIEVILNYGSRIGHDLALADIRDAAIKNKLIKIRKTKPKKQISTFTEGKGKGITWTKVPERLEALAPRGQISWIRADVINAIDAAYGAIHKQNKWDKTVAVAKMSAFYNPFFLPMYDMFQFAMTGAPVKMIGNVFVEGPKKAFSPMTKALTDVWYETDDYYRAQELGLSSKPFNMPWSKLKSDAQRLSEGKFEHINNRLGRYLAGMAYQGLKDLPKVHRGSIFKTMYEASFTGAWLMDATVRQMTYNFLVKEGVTEQEAAQTAAKFHGDYASVPAGTRKLLNRFLFTPTFKIAMSKLYIDMVKNLGVGMAKLATGKAKDLTGSQKVYAYGAISTLAINLAYDIAMQSLGWEPDEWGRKYVRTVRTKHGKKEIAITASNPSNMIQRYLFKILKAHHPAVENTPQYLLESLSYEITPMFKVTSDIILNRKTGGEQITSEFDSVWERNFKRVSYGLTSIFQITKLLGADASESYSSTEAREIMAKDWSKFWYFMQHFMFAYTRSPQERRTAMQMQSKIRRFSQETRRDILSGGYVDRDKVKRLREQLKQIREQGRK